MPRPRGLDLDDLFAYSTPKVVRIRDRRLGFIYYGLAILIACYVVGFQILYRNEHFERRDVFGTPRMTIQHPTRDACNPNDIGCKSDFNSLEDLPYCSVYKGHSNVAPDDQHDCIFADQHTLCPSGMLEGDLLVPTRIDKMVESRGCDPSPANNWTCDNEYDANNAENVLYVADIERYTLMVAHSYKRDTVEGNNGRIEGQYLQCVSNNDEVDEVGDLFGSLQGETECKGHYEARPIDCITDDCEYNRPEKGGGWTTKAKASFLHLWAHLTAWDRHAARPDKTVIEKDDDLPRHTHGHRKMLNRGQPHRNSDNVLLVTASADSYSKSDPESEVEAQAKAEAVQEHSRRLRKKSDRRGLEAEIEAKAKEEYAGQSASAVGKPSPAQLAAGGVFAIPDGDIFTVWKLLKLAGLTLDHTFNLDNEPLREAGTVIEIEVQYSNLVPFASSFGYMPVSYQYKISRRPMQKMKTEVYAISQPEYPEKRIIENRHGLYVTVKIGGSFGFFSPVYLLVMLTTAVGLFSVAVVITDMLALYAMEDHDEYRDMKYENTTLPDDSDDSEVLDHKESDDKS